MNWKTIKRFNFTWAMTDGAWIECAPVQTSNGMVKDRNWFSFVEIEKHLGREWLEKQIAAQGWMTGCWIECV